MSNFAFCRWISADDLIDFFRKINENKKSSSLLYSHHLFLRSFRFFFFLVVYARRSQIIMTSTLLWFQFFDCESLSFSFLRRDVLCSILLLHIMIRESQSSMDRYTKYIIQIHANRTTLIVAFMSTSVRTKPIRHQHSHPHCSHSIVVLFCGVRIGYV